MDQTNFSENQEVFQAPVSATPPPAEPIPASRLAQKTHRKQKIIVIAVMFSAIVILLALLLLPSSPPSTSTPSTPPEFTKPNPDQTTQFEQQVLELQSRLKDYDPTDIELAPPPVDYQLEFIPTRR